MRSKILRDKWNCASGKLEWRYLKINKTRGTGKRVAFGGAGAEPEPSLELEDAMDQQKLWSLGFIAWKLGLLEKTRFGGKGNNQGPEDLLRSCDRHQGASLEITNSRKFWSKRLFTPKLGASIDTVFWEIGQKRNKEKQPILQEV
jgi:hypothetical protein